MPFSYKKHAPTWMTKETAEALIAKSKELREHAEKLRAELEEKRASYKGPERRQHWRPLAPAWTMDERLKHAARKQSQRRFTGAVITGFDDDDESGGGGA